MTTEFKWPRHKGEMCVTHNPHKSDFMSVAEYIGVEWRRDWDDSWVSGEERLKAVATNELWVFRWYPLTPTGFVEVWASTFEAALAEALRIDAEEPE